MLKLTQRAPDLSDMHLDKAAAVALDALFRRLDQLRTVNLARCVLDDGCVPSSLLLLPRAGASCSRSRAQGLRGALRGDARLPRVQADGA